MRLPDIIEQNLKILFVGYNPGLRSAELGHYYAGKTNRFWDLLNDSGLLPEPLGFEDDHRMPLFGYGLTDIIKRPSRSASEITPQEYKEGRQHLLQVIKNYRPKIVCYNGKGIYKALSKQQKVELGLQKKSVVETSLDFVAPSPSGLNMMPYQEKLAWFIKLRQLLLGLDKGIFDATQNYH